MTRSIQNKGLYLALVSQLNKLARHNRQGSFRTKDRYYEACKRFCGYLADEYHLQTSVASTLLAMCCICRSMGSRLPP